MIRGSHPRPPKPDLGALPAAALAVGGAATLVLGLAIFCTAVAAATLIPARVIALVALLPLMAATTLTHALIGDPR